MKKALLLPLALSAVLAACSDDLESSADVSKTMERDPTAAGTAIDNCIRGKTSLMAQGAPEAAIRGAGNCAPDQQQ